MTSRQPLHLTTTGWPAGMPYCHTDRSEPGFRGAHYQLAPALWETKPPEDYCEKCWETCFNYKRETK